MATEYCIVVNADRHTLMEAMNSLVKREGWRAVSHAAVWKHFPISPGYVEYSVLLERNA